MKKNKISALAKQYGVVLGFVLLICIGALLSKTCLSAQKIAELRGLPAATVAQATWDNARKLFCL